MDPFVAFWTTFTVIALAELGDKTQLLTIVLASRYRRLPVLLGVIASLSLLSLVAVLGGSVIFRYVPVSIVRALAGVSFIIFAFWTLLEKETDVEKDGACLTGSSKKAKTSLIIFSYCFCLMFVAEFGDKTQLATIVLASGMYEPVSIFLGAVLAFVVVDAPCVYAGKKLSEKVKIRHIKLGSAVLFLILGIFFIAEFAGFI